MNPLYGYHGRYLLVDLTQNTSEAIELSESTLRKVIGGSALGTHLLHQHRAYEFDPLDENSILVFAFSPLVGSPLTTSAKFAVVNKSPLTGFINDSLASSRFAILGKRTGFDAIVVTGKAKEISVLTINEDSVEVIATPNLSQKRIGETETRLDSEIGNIFSFAVIGPAGENLVRYATISHDGRHAGRGGSGAIMGAKNLKAIAVTGQRRCEWSDPDGLAATAKRLSEKSFGPATAKYRELGTAANMLTFNRLACLPTRNFQEAQFEFAHEISPESLEATRKKSRKSCAACTIGCEHLYELKKGEGPKNGSRKIRVEYESLFALGSLCGIRSQETVLRAMEKCDELGLDTISTGGTIAFAMECYETGLLRDNVGFHFGDDEKLLSLIDQIAFRQGFGNELAEGSKRLAEKIGQNSIDFAPQVKGLEIPGYEPRTMQTMALGFAVGTRGADHNRSGAYEADFGGETSRFELSEANVCAAIETEDRATLIDSLILCKFLRGVFADVYEESAQFLQQITGWKIDGDELRANVKRMMDSKKRFNDKCGWKPSDDTLPARFFESAIETEEFTAKLSRDDLDAAVLKYRELRGWE